MFQLFPSRAVAISLFGFQVHWYGLMYLLAFVIAYLLLPRLQRYRGLSLSGDQWSSILSWAIVGVIGGGRLGFVLFYEPAYYFSNPLKIFAVWEGGMASHGGFIGVSLALWYVTRSMKIPAAALADTVVVPVAIGLALGRLGNFINQELYGSVTALPWGIAIPGVEGLRHPVQLYDMIGSLFIAAVCYAHLRFSAQSATGKTCALFLVLYSIMRFLIEFVRVPDHSVLTFGALTLTRGQALTIPVFVAGIIVWVVVSRRSRLEQR